MQIAIVCLIKESLFEFFEADESMTLGSTTRKTKQLFKL